jgi:formate dehydrogenase major subunit
MTNSFNEYARAKLLFCIGTNMTEAHPVASYYVKQAVAKGATLIVVDPRRHALADHAQIFAQIKVGSDIAFLGGLMRVLIEEDLYDKSYVTECCEDFDSLKAKVLETPLEEAARLSGVEVELIQHIARTMAEIRPGMACYTLGITEHTCGKNNVMSVANLQMLLGNVGKECGGVNPMRGQNNVQGACDVGALPNVFPGYQPVTVPANREKFEKLWGVTGLPDKVGMMMPDMMDGLASKRIRGFYIYGENLANTEPNITHVEKSLAAAEFIVVQDIFLNETTRFAHVVLPAAAWGEDEGVFSSSERRVSMVRKWKNPPGEAKPSWWIFKELAKRFGQEWKSNSGREIWDDEMTMLAPAFGGIKYDRIQKDGLQWPCPNVEHPGTAFLHRDGKFTRGKGLFKAVSWTPPAEVPDDEYPLVLSTGRRLYHYHTRTQTGRAGMNQLLPEELADISPADAREHGVADGDMIILRTRRGQVNIRARVSDRIPRGLVWASFHFREGNANWLTNNAFDPETKTAEYKACAVRIERIG